MFWGDSIVSGLYGGFGPGDIGLWGLGGFGVYSDPFGGGGFGPLGLYAQPFLPSPYSSLGSFGAWDVGGGGGYFKFAWGIGPFGWSSPEDRALQRGASAVWNLVNGWGNDVNPYSLESVRRFQEMQEKKTAGDHEAISEPPSDILERAKTYFDYYVRDGKNEGNPYDYQAQSAIKKWEEEESKGNADIRGREQALRSLAQRIGNWAMGDGSRETREKFKERARAVKTTEDKLLQLVAPGAKGPGEISDEAARWMHGELGVNRQRNLGDKPKRKDIFKAYEEMLRDRFGDMYDDIINTYFNGVMEICRGDAGKSEEARRTEAAEGPGRQRETGEVYMRKGKDKVGGYPVFAKDGKSYIFVEGGSGQELPEIPGFEVIKEDSKDAFLIKDKDGKVVKVVLDDKVVKGGTKGNLYRIKKTAP
jgi:hypothetical protein